MMQALDIENKEHWSALASVANSGLALANALRNSGLQIDAASDVYIALLEVELHGARMARFLKAQFTRMQELAAQQTQKDNEAKEQASHVNIQEDEIVTTKGGYKIEKVVDYSDKEPPFPSKPEALGKNPLKNMQVCPDCGQANPADVLQCINPNCLSIHLTPAV